MICHPGTQGHVEISLKDPTSDGVDAGNEKPSHDSLCKVQNQDTLCPCALGSKQYSTIKKQDTTHKF